MLKLTEKKFNTKLNESAVIKTRNAIILSEFDNSPKIVEDFHTYYSNKLRPQPKNNKTI